MSTGKKGRFIINVKNIHYEYVSNIVCYTFFVRLSFRLVVFRLVLVSPSSLLLSLPCFPWWRIVLFCYFVSALHPPRAPCEPEVCMFPLRAVFFFFLALVMLTHLLSLILFPCSISIWTSFVFIRAKRVSN